jgi:hypothetical protein
MPCNVDFEFRRQFPDTVLAMFMSSTEYTAPFTDTHITNEYYGYYNELLATGQASTTGPGTPTLQASPYPTLLRPVTDLNPIYSAQRVFLESLEYYAYDPTLTGAAGQEAAVISAIYASKATDDAYLQSFYRNGLIANFQPNFFRPIFSIDDQNVFTGIQSSNFGNKNNKGDLSIGLPLNKCFEFYRDYSKVKRIRAYGGCSQIVDVSGTKYYQRYPILCLATFWLGSSRGAV